VKLRIEGNSIRFRISREELARLQDRCRLEAATQLYTPDGRAVEGEFIYALAIDTEGGPTRCLIEPSYIMFVLQPEALDILNGPNGEAYAYQRETTTPEGEPKRFMAYVEIDKPVKKRKRPEDWLEGE